MRPFHRLRQANSRAARALIGLALLCAALSTGCRQDMHDQPKYKAAGYSNFFADHRNNRPLVPGTVARGHLDEDDHLYAGKVDGKPAETFPASLPVDKKLLERGRDRYSIFCMPCHSPVADGNGLAVQRGMKRPPSLHIERLRKAAPGYVFDVIGNGFGAMFGLGDRIKPEDRWAIVAYVRVLQLSQNVAAEDVPPAELQRLRKGE